MQTGCNRVALVLSICGLLSLGLCGKIAAQTAHATVSAEIVSPLVLARLSDLQFGCVVVGESEGTVILDGTGNRRAAGGVSLAEGSDATTAAFTVSGQPGKGYTIVLPESVTLYSGTNALQVDGFTHDGGQVTGGLTTMHVGATLHLAPRQPIGYYSGAFEITVSYN